MFKHLLLVSALCTFLNTFSSEKSIPSLKELSWHFIKAHRNEFAEIPYCYMPLLCDIINEYESLESDPFAFLQLAYDFNIEDQIKKAIDCIALSVHQASPGKIHGDVLQFAQLTRRISQLPSGLPTRIWNRRNQINERTDQFDPPPLVDRAE